jgi:hypothetical protein
MKSSHAETNVLPQRIATMLYPTFLSTTQSIHAKTGGVFLPQHIAAML